MQEAAQTPLQFTNHNDSVRGWVLVNHPATKKERIWPARSDGFVLLYGPKKSFWLIERGWNQHNLSVEAPGEIKQLDTDSLVWLKFICELLLEPAETPPT
jgi:hypothetical protein